MKKIISTILALLMVLSLAACSSKNNSNGSNKSENTSLNNVRISAGSGTSGGGQYVYVGGISRIINTHLKGVEVVLEATKGSGENVSLLRNGDLEIASIESSIAYNAMKGIDLDEGESAFPKIRCLFASLPTYFIMTTLDGKLTNCEQFAGKNVAFGPYTGSTDISSRAVFSCLGILDKINITNSGWGDCFTAMGDGLVDAVTGGSIHPASALTELETTKDVKWVSFTDEQMEKLTSTYPYYKRVTLKADTYKSLKKDYNTIGAWQAMYASADLDDELAYMITKTVFENISELQATHSGGFTTKLENISEQPVPLHKGAYRYYKEKGIKVPPELIPPEAN